MTDFILLENGSALLQEDGDNLLLDVQGIGEGDIIITKVTIDGTEFNDYQNMTVRRSQSDSNATSSCVITLDSPYGRHSDDFVVGQEIEIFADDIDGTTKIFTGVLEKRKFIGRGTSQRLEIRGRDFTLRLMDMTAEPTVFTQTEISEIVKALLDNNEVPDITTTNVQTTDFIHPRFPVNHQSIFDAIAELAELVDYVFYVDLDKDLHFEPRKSVSSGITLDNTNILSSTFDSSREGMANRIWVYGDRYLSGFREELQMDGGSVYTLLSKPHNTQIEYLGSSLKGSIKGITLTPTSGPDYAVSFDDSQIEFLSGTDIGYSTVPPSGGSAIVNYQRELPIVKFGQDDTSIKLYGPKNLVFRDKSIRDPDNALEVLKGKLRDANPLNRIKNQIKGWFDITPGNSIIMTLEDYNLFQEETSIVSVDYKFDKNTVQSKNTITLTLSKKFLEITDQIKDVKQRIEAIESQDTQDSDTITRLIVGQDDVMVVGSHYNISTSAVTGSAYHLYSTGFVPPINPWHLASGTDQGYLSGSPVGSAFGPFVVVASGGNNYEATGSYNPGGSETPTGFGVQSFG